MKLIYREEHETISMKLARFLTSDEKYIDMVRNDEYEELVAEFIDWIRAQGLKKTNYTVRAMKAHLIDAIQNKYSSIHSHVDPREVSGITQVSKKKQDVGVPPADLPQELQDLFNKKDSGYELFQQVRLFVRDLADQVKNDTFTFPGVYVPGTPGTGKTTHVMDEIKKTGVKYEVISSVTGFSQLLSLFYFNRRDTVLILDDVNVFGSQKMTNFLKNLLQSNKLTKDYPCGIRESCYT